MAVRLACSSPPSTETVTVSPPLIPRPIRAISLVAAADLPSFSTVTVLSNALAALTSRPAGRA